MNYLPKSKTCEILASSVGENFANITAQNVREIERCLKQNLRVFNDRFVADQKTKAMGFSDRGNRRTSNLPVNKMFSIYLGLFLTGVLDSDCNGRFVHEWLCSEMSDVAAGSYDITVDPELGVFDAKSWVIALRDSIALLCNTFAITPDHYFEDVSNASDVVGRFAKVLSLFKTKDNSDDRRFAAYLTIVLRRFVIVFTHVFKVANNNRIEYHNTRYIDLWPCLRDPSTMITNFVEYTKSMFDVEELSQIRKLYEIEFDSLKVDNGFVQVPDGFYTKLVDYAINGFVEKTTERVRFENRIENFKKDVLSISRKAMVLEFCNVKTSLPSCFNVLVTEEFGTGRNSNPAIEGRLDDLKSDVEYFCRNCENVVKAFVSFFDDNFEAVSGFIRPTCKIRTTIVNGLRTIYRFDFLSLTSELYLLYKLRSTLKADSTIPREVEFDPLGKFTIRTGGEDLIQEDYKMHTMYMRTSVDHDYYGTVDLSDDEKFFLIDQNRRKYIEEVDQERWAYHIDDNILTVLPPSKGLKTLVVRLAGSEGASGNLRENVGMEYVVREIDVSGDKYKDVSMLDLWFSYPRHLLSNVMGIKALYEKALSSFGSLGWTIPETRLLEFPEFKIYTPAWLKLLSLAGVDRTIFNAAQVHKILPYNVPADDTTFNNAYDNVLEMNREFIFEFPVPKRNVKSYYANKVGDGAVIWKTGEERFGKPLCTLYKQDFNQTSHKDCYKAVACLDILFDFNFQNLRDKIVNEKKMILMLAADIPGLDNVLYEYDEKFAIYRMQHGDARGRQVDPPDLHTAPFLSNDPLVDAYRCVENLFGLCFYDPKMVKRTQRNSVIQSLKEIQQFLSDYFNISDYDIWNVIDGVSSSLGIKETFEKLIEYLDVDKDYAKSSLPKIKDLYLKFSNKNYADVGLPYIFTGNYGTLLRDSYTQKGRFPAVGTRASLVVNLLSPFVFEESERIMDIAKLFCEFTLRNNYTWW